MRSFDFTITLIKNLSWFEKEGVSAVPAKVSVVSELLI